MKIGKSLKQQADDIAEVAGWLWQRGWAERNGGNISVNISDRVGKKHWPVKLFTTHSLPAELKGLSENYFYITAMGSRMRDVARNPLSHGVIIRIHQNGKKYDKFGRHSLKPTSELSTHLAIHAFFKQNKSTHKIVLHTHPTELIALTHIEKFSSDAPLLSRTLQSMLPETCIVVPRGVGIVPYELPGSMALASKTIEALNHHDIVLWEKHGALGVGEDILEVFDLLDTLTKSARIYQFARSTGYEPQGLTGEQLKRLMNQFNPGIGFEQNVQL